MRLYVRANRPRDHVASSDDEIIDTFNEQGNLGAALLASTKLTQQIGAGLQRLERAARQQTGRRWTRQNPRPDGINMAIRDQREKLLTASKTLRRMLTTLCDNRAGMTWLLEHRRQTRSPLQSPPMSPRPMTRQTRRQSTTGWQSFVPAGTLNGQRVFTLAGTEPDDELDQDLDGTVSEPVPPAGRARRVRNNRPFRPRNNTPLRRSNAGSKIRRARMLA
jgi:hypothetical protein